MNTVESAFLSSCFGLASEYCRAILTTCSILNYTVLYTFFKCFDVFLKCLSIINIFDRNYVSNLIG